MIKKKVLLVISLLISICLLVSCTPSTPTNSGGASETRKNTLYVTGMAWGAPTNFNWFTGYPTWPVNIQSNPLVYEMLFMYNIQTKELEPLLAKSYTWKDDTTVEIKLNEAATFNDGKPVTAEDVYYTMDLGRRYDMVWSSIWQHMKDVVVIDDQTLEIKLKTDDHNILAIEECLALVPIHPKHIWEPLEKECQYDFAKLTEIFNENPVGSGPYKIKFYDETKIVLERNDQYWGKELLGGLPVPQYITHLLFNSNDTATTALKNGDLDYSEDFIPNVKKLFEEGIPIRTYLDASPYYVSDTIPMLFVNLHKPGLEQVEVRKAIAYAINSQEIIDKAISGYSPMMEPGVTVNVSKESDLVDKDVLKPLQWSYDLDKANELLDSIGAKRGADGIRVLPDGTRLGPWKLECPYGWSDWNATLEIVMQNAKAVGIELQTEFPEWAIWDNHKRTGEFDLLMETPAAYTTPANPWKRANDILSSVNIPPVGESAFSNYGRYENPRADELLKLIPTTSDPTLLKTYYTELNQIYLTDIPTIPLMYRPTYYYTVNESVWSGFPTENSNSDAPPYLFDGAGVKGLYQLKVK